MVLGGLGEGDEPDEPEEALRGGVLLSLQLIPAQVLDVFGLGGSGELPVADFLGSSQLMPQCLFRSIVRRYLDIAKHVILDRGESDGAEDI